MLVVLIPNQQGKAVATVVPPIIVLVAVFIWGIIVIATASPLKDVIGWTAGYTAVLGIFLNGAASMREVLFPPTNISNCTMTASTG